jgi:hypothetical protein
MSMARLWREQGKVHQAREVLAPVYGWFKEGLDMRDLKKAKALLDELVVRRLLDKLGQRGQCGSGFGTQYRFSAGSPSLYLPVVSPDAQIGIAMR